MNERRTHIRFPFDGKAYLTYNGRCRCEDVVDVSAEGLQLQSSARLKPGKPIKVFLPIEKEDGWRLCLLKGTVARREKGKRLGVSFDPDALDTRALLQQYIAGCN